MSTPLEESKGWTTWSVVSREVVKWIGGNSLVGPGGSGMDFPSEMRCHVGSSNYQKAISVPIGSVVHDHLWKWITRYFMSQNMLSLNIREGHNVDDIDHCCEFFNRICAFLSRFIKIWTSSRAMCVTMPRSCTARTTRDIRSVTWFGNRHLQRSNQYQDSRLRCKIT